MNSANANNPDSSKTALYALIASHISALLFFIANAILNQAPFLNFWLPALGFFILNGYISVDAYKKRDAQAVAKEKTPLKMGIIVLLLLLFVIATKDWKASPLDISDAVILTLLLSNTKDYLADMLAMRPFANKPDIKK